MSNTNFKVIIVGGGPVGLTAAHALRLAGIDFTILERRSSIVVEVGATLALGAGSLRVMHQMGLLEKIKAIGTELHYKRVATFDGRVIQDAPLFRYMTRNHGSALLVFNRSKFLKILYESLPEDQRANILTDKSVVDIVGDDSGVKVACADGSIYEGSMVLGADGAHSKTRSLMRSMALESDDNREWDPEHPFLTTFRCMWSSFPRFSEPGLVFEMHHQHRSVMCISGQDCTWVFLGDSLSEPTSQRVSYTEEETEAYSAMFSEFLVSEKLRLKDIRAQLIARAMIHLEEGLVKNWSWGRIVLAGDSCHKFTPNAGLGFQNGIQDVVDLCNRLHKARDTAPGGLPSAAALNELFQSYQAYRRNALRVDETLSAFMIRLQSQTTRFHSIMSRYIMPSSLASHVLLNYVTPWNDKKTLVLDYVAAEEPYKGAVPWVHKMKKPSTTIAG